MTQRISAIWSLVPLPLWNLVCFELWTRYKKTQKPNRHFWRSGGKRRVSGTKAGYHTCPLHTIPPKIWADHLSQASGLTHGHTSTLTPFKEPASIRQWARKLVTWFGFLLLQPGPNKALLKFLVCYLSNFYWLRRPRTLVDNTDTKFNVHTHDKKSRYNWKIWVPHHLVSERVLDREIVPLQNAHKQCTKFSRIKVYHYLERSRGKKWS